MPPGHVKPGDKGNVKAMPDASKRDAPLWVTRSRLTVAGNATEQPEPSAPRCAIGLCGPVGIGQQQGTPLAGGLPYGLNVTKKIRGYPIPAPCGLDPIQNRGGQYFSQG